MNAKVIIYFSFFLVFISVLVLSCSKKEKVTPLIQSTILTVKDSLMAGGGVRLFGKVLSDPQITDYGFEYGEDSLFVKSTKISLGTKVTENFFADILEGLISGHKYFFRAYETLTGSEKRGTTLSFLSQGSKPIVITGTLPAAGMGDTITIHGKYFDIKKTAVYFDAYRAKQLSITDSVITCIIPYLPERYNNGLTLKDTDNTRYTYQTYHLAAPVITSFTNKKFIDDKVEIIGDHFDRISNFATEVDFGTVKAQIISTSRTKMVVVVPTIYNTPVSLKVTGQFQSTTAASQFSLTAPVITQVASDATTLSFLTINGSNFFPNYLYDYNQVFVNGVKADIYTATSSSIKIRVPEAPYPTRKATISVNVLGQTVNYNGTLNVTDKWLMMAYNLPFASPFANGSFVINNQAYYLAPIGGTGAIYVFKYNSASNTWSQYQQLTQLNYAVQGVAVVNSKAYIYSGASGGTFWQYDPASKQLTAMAQFPGTARSIPTMFSVGSTVYLGLGVATGALNDFYAYNTQTNTWKAVTGFSSNYFDGVAGSFVIGTKGYIVYRTYEGNWLEQYDTQTDSWTAKAPLVNAYNIAIGFSLNNMGYVCGVTTDNYSDNCFQYNPATNTWTQKPKVGEGRYNAARSAFTLGSKAYVFTDNANGTAATLYSADGIDIQ